MTRTRSIHYCNVCDYKTDRKYDRDKHVYRMHGSNVQQNVRQAIKEQSTQIQSGSGSVVTSTHIPMEKYNEALDMIHKLKALYRNSKKEKMEYEMQTNRAPVTMSIGDNVGRAPTSVFVGNDAPTAPTSMYTEPIQIGTGPPKHVSMELYQKAVKAIFNWAKVHKNDVEEKNKLSEELHYEKVAKEALPIHIDNNILKKISILRGVKKNHNMGHYPEEMIHCICEAIWNLNKKADKMMCGYTICKLRTSMCGIHRYLRKLSSKNVSMKKKRRILSKPQVGKGIFTAIASFVLPALISLITKK